MSLYVKATTVEAREAAADLSGLEGYFIKLSAGAPVLVTAATDIPYGLLVDADVVGGPNSIAISGGNTGSHRVKVAGSVSKGQHGQLTAAGSAIADAGTGARTIVCEFLEDGVVDELVEAILFKPVAIGHAVTLASTDGTAGAAADLPGLKAETEHIGDDVRAIYAALQAAGILA